MAANTGSSPFRQPAQQPQMAEVTGFTWPSSVVVLQKAHIMRHVRKQACCAGTQSTTWPSPYHSSVTQKGAG